MALENETRQDLEFREPATTGQPGEPAKPAPQARQGVATGRILAVLIVGLMLVVAGFAISYVGAV
ncbi:MAG: hypothetical protein AB1592_01005 [Pseudomonadota bacterium]